MSNGTLVWNEARDRGLEKWQRGQLEHGGDLYRKPTLDEAIDEALDLIPYLFIHRAHVHRAVAHLKAIDLRSLPPATLVARDHREADLRQIGKLLLRQAGRLAQRLERRANRFQRIHFTGNGKPIALRRQWKCLNLHELPAEQKISKETCGKALDNYRRPGAQSCPWTQPDLPEA